jgi:hypothetical protein
MELKSDPGIMRIRRVRHRISEECDHDPRKVVDHYIKLQKRYTGRLLAPKEEMEISGEPVVA